MDVQIQMVNRSLDTMEGEMANIKLKSASEKISRHSGTKGARVDQDHQDSDPSSDGFLILNVSHV